MKLNENTNDKIKDWLNKSENFINTNWDKLKKFSKREKQETIVALRILKKLIIGKEVSDTQIKFLKIQMIDLVKVLFLISLKAIPSPIPFTPLVMMLGSKIGINVLPTSHDKYKIKDLE
jgi:hypothetical protein